MIIILPNTAEFDTELDFENQTTLCQEYFFYVMNTTEPTTILDEFNRPLTQTWEVLSIGFTVSRNSEYLTQGSAWNLKNQFHTTERKAWHEDKEFQIIMSTLQFAELSKDYPDFVYVENKKRNSYIENDFIYQYTDTLLPEHRAVLEDYGITINNKE